MMMLKLTVCCLFVLIFAPVKGQDGPQDMFLCKNGQVIESALKCDDVYDCDDQSDETVDICGVLPCEVDETRCKISNECIPSKYLCDGYPDCQDSTDELYCTEGRTVDEEGNINSTHGIACPEGTEFVCTDLTGCFTCDHMCNGQINCEDGSDEVDENCLETCNKKPATTTSTTTTTLATTTTTKKPVPKGPVPKICKRNATKKACVPFISQIANTLPFKIFKKCQRKSSSKKCRRFAPVLRLMLTKEFQAARCHADPKMCGKFENGGKKNNKRKKRGGKGRRKKRQPKE